ncbi:helix-turn-helix domain-containing protein [Rossellomorea vietnamensis]
MNLNNFDFSVYKKKQNFGEIIRILRVENGFSASQLAEQLRVTEDFIVNTELNRTHPSKFFIHALANVLQKNYDDLLDELYDVEHKEILKLLK